MDPLPAQSSTRIKGIGPAFAAALLLVTSLACSSPHHAPALIAHRGNSSEAPENTLAAVHSALLLEEPPEYVEIDVRRCADGALAVIHDRSLERTTDGSGLVAETSWARLRELRAGFPERFGDRFPNERIPSLEETLEATVGTDTGVMIEIKSARTGWEIAEAISNRGESHKHLIASFDPSVVVDAERHPSHPRTLFLHERATPEVIELAARIGADIFGCDHHALSAEAVAEAHREGLAVWAWTVNDPERATTLLGWGVNGIISDQPRAMRANTEL